MEFSESLKKNRDFQYVYKNGRSAANRYLVLYQMENSLKKNRLGISVSKKVGNSVIRHRLTRLIYRLHEKEFSCGYDMIFIARPGAKKCTYREVESALLHLGKIQNLMIRLEHEGNEQR